MLRRQERKSGAATPQQPVGSVSPASVFPASPSAAPSSVGRVGHSPRGRVSGASCGRGSGRPEAGDAGEGPSRREACVSWSDGPRGAAGSRAAARLQAEAPCDSAVLRAEAPGSHGLTVPVARGPLHVCPPGRRAPVWRGRRTSLVTAVLFQRCFSEHLFCPSVTQEEVFTACGPVHSTASPPPHPSFPGAVICLHSVSHTLFFK